MSSLHVVLLSIIVTVAQIEQQPDQVQGAVAVRPLKRTGCSQQLRSQGLLSLN